MAYDGFFIAVEGIDGSGKTTLICRLVKALREVQQEVVETKEPGSAGFLGKQLCTILQEHQEPLEGKAEFLLFAADRAQHFQHFIIPALERGNVVITDRCADSSLAYQGYGRGIDRGMIEKINEWVMQGVSPDLTFYLKIDFETAYTRLAQKRKVLSSFEKEDAHFWQRVIRGYDEVFAARSNVCTIEAVSDEETMFTHAWNCLIDAVRNHPLAYKLKV